MLNAYSKIVRHIYSYCFKNVHRTLFKMFNGYKKCSGYIIGFGYSMDIKNVHRVLFKMFNGYK